MKNLVKSENPTQGGAARITSESLPLEYNRYLFNVQDVQSHKKIRDRRSVETLGLPGEARTSGRYETLGIPGDGDTSNIALSQGQVKQGVRL